MNSTSLPYYSRLLRIVAGFVVMIFSLTTILEAAPLSINTTPSLTIQKSFPAYLNIPSLELSPSIGSVHDSFIRKDNKKTVYLIQDAHESLDAQKNIRLILEELVKSKQVDFVAFEGGSRQLDRSFYSFVEDINLNQKVIDQLFKEGFISGLERFAIDATKNTKLFGVEDETVYFQNINSIKNIYEEQIKHQSTIEEINKEFQSRRSRLVTGDLKKILDQRQAFDEERLPLFSYARALARKAKTSIDLDLNNPKYQNQYPQLVRLMMLSAMEADLEKNKETIAKEIEQIQPYLKKAQGHLRWSIEQAIDKGLISQSAIRNPHIRAFIGFHILKDELKTQDLFTEIKLLEKQLIKNLDLPREVKQFIVEKEYWNLTKKLITLKLTRKEWKVLGKWIFDTPSGVSKMRVPTTQLNPLISLAKQNYTLVEQRDTILIQNALSRIRELKSKNAALIVGGFHTEPIKEELEKQNINYVIINPSILEPKHKLNYQSRIHPNFENNQTALAIASSLGGEEANLYASITRKRASEIIQIVKASSLGNSMHDLKRQVLGGNLDSANAYINLLIRQKGYTIESIREVLAVLNAADMAEEEKKGIRDEFVGREEVKEIFKFEEDQARKIFDEFLMESNIKIVILHEDTFEIKVIKETGGISIDFSIPAYSGGWPLYNAPLNGAKLSVLKRIPLLEELNLNDKGIRNEDIGEIAEIKSLKKLYLFWSPRLNEVGGLSALPVLEELSLRRLGIRNEDIGEIAKIKSLKKLSLSGNKELNEVGGLSELPSLEELNLYETGIKNSGISGIAEIKSLKKLSLSANKELNEFGGLSELSSLEELGLNRTSIRNESIAGIAKIKSLKKLSLSDAGLTKEQIQAFFQDPENPGQIRHEEWGDLEIVHDEGTIRWEDIEKELANQKLSEQFQKALEVKELVEGNDSDAESGDQTQIKASSLGGSVLKGFEKRTLAGDVEAAYKYSHLYFRQHGVSAKNVRGVLAVLNQADATDDEMDPVINELINRDDVSQVLETERKKAVQILEKLFSLDSAQTLLGGKSLDERVQFLRRSGNLSVDLNDVVLEELGLNFLKEIEGLEELYLSGAAITNGDIKTIVQIQSLRVLDLSQNLDLDDLSELPKLPRLEWLDLSETGIDDLTPVADIEGLRTLNISYNDSLTDYRPLTQMFQLQALALRGLYLDNQIVPILLTIQGLKMLSLSDNPLFYDFAILANLRDLEELHLEYMTLRNQDIPEIAKIKSLRVLKLAENQSLSRFEALAKVPGLEELYLKDTDIKYASIGGIAKIKSLRALDLSENTELTLGALWKIPDLEVLNLSSVFGDWNRTIKAISKIKHLKRLTLEGVGGNLVGLEKLLKNLELEFLCLEHTNVGKPHIPILAQMKNLKELHLVDTKIKTEDVFSLFQDPEKPGQIRHEEWGDLEIIHDEGTIRWEDVEKELANQKLSEQFQKALEVKEMIEGNDSDAEAGDQTQTKASSLGNGLAELRRQALGGNLDAANAYINLLIRQKGYTIGSVREILGVINKADISDDERTSLRYPFISNKEVTTVMKEEEERIEELLKEKISFSPIYGYFSVRNNAIRVFIDHDTAGAGVYAITKNFSKDQLKSILDIPSLEQLALRGCDINDQDVKEIAKVKSLRELNLEGNPKIKNVLALSDMPNLEVLNLAMTGVDVQAVVVSSKIKSLKELRLNNNSKIARLYPLSTHPRLERLFITNTGHGYKDMNSLVNIKSLREVKVSSSQVSKNYIKEGFFQDPKNSGKLRHEEWRELTVSVGRTVISGEDIEKELANQVLSQQFQKALEVKELVEGNDPDVEAGEQTQTKASSLGNGMSELKRQALGGNLDAANAYINLLIRQKGYTIESIREVLAVLNAADMAEEEKAGIREEFVGREDVEYVKRQKALEVIRGLVGEVEDDSVRIIKRTGGLLVFLFKDLRSVNLSKLKEIPYLEELNLMGSRYGNDKIAEIAEIRSLKKLTLAYNQSLTQIEGLSALAELEDLNLSDTKIDERSIPEINQMKKLRKLNVSSTYIGGRHLAELDSQIEVTANSLGRKKLNDLGAITFEQHEQIRARLDRASGRRPVIPVTAQGHSLGKNQETVKGFSLGAQGALVQVITERRINPIWFHEVVDSKLSWDFAQAKALSSGINPNRVAPGMRLERHRYRAERDGSENSWWAQIHKEGNQRTGAGVKAMIEKGVDRLDVLYRRYPISLHASNRSNGAWYLTHQILHDVFLTTITLDERKKFLEIILKAKKQLAQEPDKNEQFSIRKIGLFGINNPVSEEGVEPDVSLVNLSEMFARLGAYYLMNKLNIRSYEYEHDSDVFFDNKEVFKQATDFFDSIGLLATEEQLQTFADAFNIAYGNSLGSILTVTTMTRKVIGLDLKKYFPQIYEQIWAELFLEKPSKVSQLLQTLSQDSKLKQLLSYLDQDSSAFVVTGEVSPRALMLQMMGHSTVVAYHRGEDYKQSFDSLVQRALEKGKISSEEKKDLEKRGYFVRLPEEQASSEFLEDLFEGRRVQTNRGKLSLSKMAQLSGHPVKQIRNKLVWLGQEKIVEEVLGRVIVGFGLPLQSEEYSAQGKFSKEFYDIIRLSIAAWLSLDPEFLMQSGYVEFSDDRYHVTDHFIQTYLEDAFLQRQVTQLISQMA